MIMRLRLQGQKGPQSLAEAARLARAQPAAVPRSRCTLAPATLRLLRCWTVAVLPLPTQRDEQAKQAAGFGAKD